MCGCQASGVSVYAGPQAQVRGEVGAGKPDLGGGGHCGHGIHSESDL